MGAVPAHVSESQIDPRYWHIEQNMQFYEQSQAVTAREGLNEMFNDGSYGSYTTPAVVGVVDDLAR